MVYAITNGREERGSRESTNWHIYCRIFVCYPIYSFFLGDGMKALMIVLAVATIASANVENDWHISRAKAEIVRLVKELQTAPERKRKYIQSQIKAQKTIIRLYSENN